MNLQAMLFTFVFIAAVLFFGYCHGVYSRWMEEEQEWKKTPVLYAQSVSREKRGDVVRVSYPINDLLPKSYSKARLMLKQPYTQVSIGAPTQVSRVEERVVILFCETTSSLGGDMNNPEMEIKRKPFIDLVLKDRLPDALIQS